jgi:3'-phosphoadenosine 5'-phosphosulfate synthase
MMYAGPTEVQFHARSRQVAGASYFVVGRDPAGMPYQSGPEEGEDLYHSDHGKYVMLHTPGLQGLGVLGFPKAYYDKSDHKMKPKDKSRADDFISISGTKMRKLAFLGATPCAEPIPSDLVEAKCIPPVRPCTSNFRSIHKCL